jgi:hypothetical protein
MKISIAERLKPYSHLPGTSTVLPGTYFAVDIFPCLIRIYELNQARPILRFELPIDLRGPVEQFTVFNDLEKGWISVSGKAASGWIRYRLIGSQKGDQIRFLLDKAPLGSCAVSGTLLQEKEWTDLLHTEVPFEPFLIPACDRLSLGSNKAQDWESIKRRMDLAELFPFLHRMGQLLPSFPIPQKSEGTLSLLEACQQCLTDERPERGEKYWRNFIRGAFSGILFPQFEDPLHQGLIPSQPLNSFDASPVILLSEGSRLIRSLFIQQEKGRISILPYLLPQLPQGRLIDIQLEGGGLLSFEWTKKTIRRLVLYSEQQNDLSIHFRHVKSYRLRCNSLGPGERISVASSLSLNKNSYYSFDNFK